ncbi:MAG TPA: hypothetical protein VNJ08_11955 [Bacteriovoracaceae bacterium]|nr:hypothetical protein [Bacteriovoracaceae bacterium]
MSPKFFFHKMREVASFLQIMKGKITGNDKERVEGVNNALNAMKDEKEVYLEEKEDAQKSRHRTRARKSSSKEKVIRESNRDIERDISAI